MNSTIKIPQKISALSLDHVIIGVEINEADNIVFSYLDSLLNNIPCKEMTFVHVVPSLPMIDVLPYEGMDDIVLDSIWIQSLESKIRQIIPGRLSLIKHQVKIREGSPLEELIKETKGKTKTLLVIGQEADIHQHDIQASSMARNSPGNVLIIPEYSSIELNKILVPVDFSKTSVKALEYAISIAQQIDEELIVECLNVYDVPDISSYRISRTPKQLDQIVKDHHEQLLNQMIQDYNGSVNLTGRVIKRDMPGIAPYIMKYALETEASLIVMGAMGHSKMELLFMGSVTEKLLRINKQIPSLIVK